MSNLSLSLLVASETLWVLHQSVWLYKLKCSASEAGWKVNEFAMWTLLVLCGVIASHGVQGIVHYFLIVMFVSLFFGLWVFGRLLLPVLSLVFKWLMYSDLLSCLFVFLITHQVLNASKQLAK